MQFWTRLRVVPSNASHSDDGVTCLIVSFAQSCIHTCRYFYFIIFLKKKLSFGPKVDSQVIFNNSVFRIFGQSRGSTLTWLVYYNNYWLLSRYEECIFFGVHFGFFFRSASARTETERSWGSEKVGNSENSWKIRAVAEYIQVTAKISWLQTSHHLTAKFKMAASSKKTDSTHRYTID